MATAGINGPANSSQGSKPKVVAGFGQLPLIFEPNVGQTDPHVQFLARAAGYTLFLDGKAATLGLRSRVSASAERIETLRMKLPGAKPNPAITAVDPLPGKTNYFLGNDPAQWHHDVPQYAAVRYEDVYPGISLVFHGNQGRLEYDFHVAPGGNPSQAELQFDGSRSLELTDGALLVKGEYGTVRFEAPHVFQQNEGREQPVEGRFILRSANRVGFELGGYDHSRELIIDPVLTYSTYFGGSGSEICPSFVAGATVTPGCPAIAADIGGNIYLAGATNSPAASFPQPVGGSTLISGSTNANVFVAKLDSTGQRLLFLAFLGGGGSDAPTGIAVDNGNNVYVAGTTTSGIGTADFPTTPTNAYQTTPESGSKGTSHVFVSVLNSTFSTLNYSSYLSGNGTDIASGLAIDQKGNLYVTGTTTSSDAGTISDQFPASAPPEQPPFQATPRAATQFFVTKVNTIASGPGSIAYSTYFGGGTPSNGIAVGGGITLDSTGNIYFSGTTNFVYTGTSPTTDFPILNAYQACLNVPTPNTTTGPVTCTATSSTATDAFVAKLNPSAPQGTQLLWSTYFGGTGNDSSSDLAVDTGAANVYIAGTTNSGDITVPNGIAPYQRCLDTPVNPASGTACPTITAPAATDAFVARLSNPTSSNMSASYFSYLGGTGNDAASSLTVDTANGAILTGWTQSTDFPFFPNQASNPTCTATAPCVIQSKLNGTENAFYAHINTTSTTSTTTSNATVGQYVTYFGGNGTDRGTSVALDSSLNSYLAGDTTSTAAFPLATPLQGAINGTSDAFAAKLGTAADLCITCTLVTFTPTVVSAGNQVTFDYTITNNGPDLASNITVTANFIGDANVTPVSMNASPGTCNSGGATTTTLTCAIPSLQSGATDKITVVVTPTTGGNFNGGAVSVFAPNDPDPSNNSTSLSAFANDFSISISPVSQAIPAAGDTAKYTVTVTPNPIYGANVALNCSSGVPSAASCNFANSTITLNGTSPISTILSLTTQPRPVPVAASRFWSKRVYAIWLVLPGMALFGFGAGNKTSRRIAGLVLLSFVLSLILLQPACSGSSTATTVSGTPAGTYKIILTATSGSDTKNATFTLTVP